MCSPQRPVNRYTRKFMNQLLVPAPVTPSRWPSCVGVDFDGFLDRTHFWRWFAMVSRAKKWLHHYTGVLAPAGVFAFFAVSVATLNMCLDHQCRCRYVRYTDVFDISLHVCKLTLRWVCTCTYVGAVCWLALGGKGGWVQLVCRALVAGRSGVGRYFGHEER